MYSCYLYVSSVLISLRLDFKSVKAMAIQSLIELEKQDKITRSNGFQEILNDIAYDVRSKHRRRLQRQQEMQNMQEALTQLAERKVHFQKQIDAYNDYMKDALSTMQRGKYVSPYHTRRAVMLTV